MSGQPPSVPAGWAVRWSDQYQTWFYVNTYTEVSQWHPPTEPVFPPSYSSFPSTAPPSGATGHPHSFQPSRPAVMVTSHLEGDEALASRLQAQWDAGDAPSAQWPRPAKPESHDPGVRMSSPLHDSRPAMPPRPQLYQHSSSEPYMKQDQGPCGSTDHAPQQQQAPPSGSNKYISKFIDKYGNKIPYAGAAVGAYTPAASGSAPTPTPSSSSYAHGHEHHHQNSLQAPPPGHGNLHHSAPTSRPATPNYHNHLDPNPGSYNGEHSGHSPSGGKHSSKIGTVGATAGAGGALAAGAYGLQKATEMWKDRSRRHSSSNDHGKDNEWAAWFNEGSSFRHDWSKKKKKDKKKQKKDEEEIDVGGGGGGGGEEENGDDGGGGGDDDGSWLEGGGEAAAEIVGALLSV